MERLAGIIPRHERLGVIHLRSPTVNEFGAFSARGGGLFCLTMDGKQVWNRDLGEFPGPWGTAASPILIDNMLIQEL